MRRIAGCLLVLACGFGATPLIAIAQQTNGPAPDEGLPTLFSVKVGAGWGIGTSRQLYGYSGSDQVYWSTGQGIKMNLALDLPIMPIEVVNGETEVGPSKIPVVALELEVASGYLPSTGGTTVDAVSGGVQTTSRSTSYVPITIGLNARSSFGPGLPAVYIGAGGGVYLVALYQENVSFSGLTPQPGFTRNINPPLPFGFYGAMGIEFPVLYSSEDGNSLLDIYAEARLTAMSTYIYNYQVTKSGAISTVDAATDPTQLYTHEPEHSASNVALTLGIKFNIY